MPPVENALGLFEELQHTKLTTVPNRCVAVRNRNAGCRRCVDACPQNCISYEENELLIDLAQCVGCGVCANACPTAALEACRPKDDELLKACAQACMKTGGELVIACETLRAAAAGYFDPEKVACVPCLGRVDESIIVMMAVAGAKRVRLACGECETCTLAHGAEMAQQAVACAKALLTTWNCATPVSIERKLPTSTILHDKGYDATKRNFFATAKDEVREVAAVAAGHAAAEALGNAEEEQPKFAHVTKNGMLPQFVPARHKRILGSLKKLGEPQNELIGVRLWGHVVIDVEMCSSCRMCATFCPTGALSKFDAADGTFGVVHLPGACVKCNCCEDICPTRALTLSDEVFAVDLHAGVVERTPMKPVTHKLGDPHQILHSMKDLLGCSQVYER